MRLLSATAKAGYTKTVFDDGDVFISEDSFWASDDVPSGWNLAGTSEADPLLLPAAAEPDVGPEFSGRLVGIVVDDELLAIGQLRVRDAGKVVIDRRSGAGLSRELHQLDEPSAPQAEAAEVSLVSAGRSGDLVFVEAYVSRATDLRSYQVGARATGGSTGELKLDAVEIDTDRDDYVFSSLDAISADDQVSGRIAGVLVDGGIDTDVPAYLGTFIFRMQGDATGTFSVSIDDAKSFLADSANQIMPAGRGSPVTVTLRNRNDR